LLKAKLNPLDPSLRSGDKRRQLAYLSPDRSPPLPRLLDRQTPVHFIGVGGIGMSALARILVDRGHPVSGSDPRDNATTQQLKTLGVKVFPRQDATCIDAVTGSTNAGSPVVVISTAIPESNPELQRARQQGLEIWHRSDLLAALIEQQPSIAVAGSPGPMASSMAANPAWQAEPLLDQLYGKDWRELPTANPNLRLVTSFEREVDLVELEQLCDAVGWSRRPLRRVRKALSNSLLVVGLWRHDPRVPKLIGFARCTGDGVLDATIWDLAIHPLYQGAGLGKGLMQVLLERLRAMEVEKVTLFADANVVSFYKAQGWDLEPRGERCVFWYAR